MTLAYVIPKPVLSLAVMGTYLSLIDQDLSPDGDPLKILYAQRIGFFPSVSVVDGREIIDRVNRDLNGSTIQLSRFLNGLIKNRLLVQSQTMVRNIEKRYRQWYKLDRKDPKKLTDTSLDNRSAVYLPPETMVVIMERVVRGTMSGAFQQVSEGDGNPYLICMNEMNTEFHLICQSDGTLAPAPFSSTRFFACLNSFMSILKAATEIPEEDYRYRMLRITKMIFVLCRMFNGDIRDMNFDRVLAVGSCDPNLYVSDSTLAIMSGCTSDVIRSLGIHELTPISRKGQFYLVACDSFVGERQILDSDG